MPTGTIVGPLGVNALAQKGLFGPGTAAHCSPDHLTDGKPTIDFEWDGRFFDQQGHATESWAELSGHGRNGVISKRQWTSLVTVASGRYRHQGTCQETCAQRLGSRPALIWC
ncbi:hypothetical protein BKA66DRAFT_268947 [Pyrenochaeta sp. MPI-SDFR-AT-0127]|nr:hypothetical protein BKA66DRAFT_268947 [Pyrenochaeta sp. MPI-SDFR-AT-0127]